MVRRFAVVTLAIAGCSDEPTDCAAWRQWGNDAAHAGTSCVSGQPLETALADVVYDPFTAQEEADADGDLIIHYQAPLIEGDDIYMMTKTGAYTPCNTVAGMTDCFEPSEKFRLHTQVWTEKRYRWDGANLVEKWSYDSDWKPEPLLGFEAMFQPAIDGDQIAIPAAGGELVLLDRETGHEIVRVRPFGAPIDRDRYVAGGIAVAPDATIYYNVLGLDHDDPYSQPSQAFLVAVAPDGSVRTVDYASLLPASMVDCYGTFDFHDTSLPWPPAPNADGSPVLPATKPCGPPRPGINSTPAIGADGTIFVVVRAHFNSRYSKIVALNRDLTLNWATSLRDLLHDGCGVTIPIDGTDGDHIFDCRVGATMGVEPATNLPPAARVDDESSSSPVALPDGGVLYGAFTGYNGSRGHLIKLDAGGGFVASYDFGWDTTPAVVGTGADYKIVLKDNHYGVDAQGVDLGPYFITELDASLAPVWRFQSTETQSCVHETDGSVTCQADHPHGFEWCINAPAIDRDGVVYANSEDGHIYAIAADGTLRDRLFLDRALGAAYTPLALDHRGRVFALNNGHMTVIGK